MNLKLRDSGSGDGPKRFSDYAVNLVGTEVAALKARQESEGIEISRFYAEAARPAICAADLNFF